MNNNDRLVPRTQQSIGIYGEKKSVNEQLDKMRNQEKLQIASLAAKHMIEDPSIFNYDDFVDSNAQKREKAQITKKIDTTSRYMSGILEAADKRKFQQSVIKDKVESKKIMRDSVRIGTDEVYVTEAYKGKLKEAQRLDLIETYQEQANQAKDVQQSIKNLKKTSNSEFYKNLYNKSQFAGGDRGIPGRKGKSAISNEIDRRIQEKQNQIVEISQSLRASDVNEVQVQKERSRSRSESMERRHKERRQEMKNEEQLLLKEMKLQEDIEIKRFAEQKQEELEKQQKILTAKERYILRKQEQQPIDQEVNKQ